MVLYPNRMHVVSIEGTGVNKMSDLKGKRVSTGSPGSATEVMAFRVIEAAGLDKDKDMQRERLGVADPSMRSRTEDRRLLLGRRPADRRGHRSRRDAQCEDQDDRPQRCGRQDECQVRQPLHHGRIPAKTYPGQDNDNKIAMVWNILVTNAKMSNDDAYKIVKLIFDKKADLVAVHKEARELRLQVPTHRNSPIPWHPGALKYFADKGVKM